MKKNLLILVTSTILLSMGVGLTYGGPIKIGICQIVEHPALDAVRNGVIESLSDAGYKEGSDVIYLIANAQGDMGTALSIAQNFKAQNVDLVVAIATPTAQATAEVFRGSATPIVFSAVTDPIATGLVLSADDPSGNGNITGVSDLIDVASDLRLLKELDSSIKRIGMVYNPGEANSNRLTEIAVAKAGEMGLSIVKAMADSTANVSIAAQSLIGRVDAIYVTTDNTVVSAIDAVVAAAEEAGILYLQADPTSLKFGPTIATGFDYYQQGILTGNVVAEILTGKKPNEIPVTYQSGAQVHLNLDAADKIGFVFPQSVIEKAASILYGGIVWEREETE
jgi:putative ABC transport system substrate-binding protein